MDTPFYESICDVKFKEADHIHLLLSVWPVSTLYPMCLTEKRARIPLAFPKCSCTVSEGNEVLFLNPKNDGIITSQ